MASRVEAQHGHEPIKPSSHTRHQDHEKHWIQGAVNPKHKGMEQRAAKRAGESTHEYMEQHKGDSGSAGARARLGLRFEAMHHKG